MQHIHAARECNLAGLVGSHLDDYRFVQRQCSLDVQRREDDLRAAGLVRSPQDVGGTRVLDRAWLARHTRLFVGGGVRR